jgi:hypothetical protein
VRGCAECELWGLQYSTLYGYAELVHFGCFVYTG